jgi:mycothiol synthase
MNEADAIDKQERATTVREMEHEMSFPTYHPETDCFLAWEDDRLVGYVSIYVAEGDAHTDSTIYCHGVVHPERRRQGLGRQLLAKGTLRARERMAGIPQGRVRLQCMAGDSEEGRKALFEGVDMKAVRYWVNLARPINNGLPKLQLPDDFRLRHFRGEQDVEAIWKVDNSAFRDHWGHTDSKVEDFYHWVKAPHFRPELWFLAEEVATGEVVGLGLNMIDPDWIARTGRQEGYVDTLAVVREHRQRGLGSALLVQGLRALRDAGMEAAHLHADAENLTGAMRLYERVGFRVRRTRASYQKLLRA